MVPDCTPLSVAPVKFVPARLAPVRLAPVRLAPVRLIPARLIPARLHPDKSTPGLRWLQSLLDATAAAVTCTLAVSVELGMNVAVDGTDCIMNEVAVAPGVASANDSRQLAPWLSLLLPSGQLVLFQIEVVGVLPEKSAPVRLVLVKFVAVNVALVKSTAVSADPEKSLVVRVVFAKVVFINKAFVALTLVNVAPHHPSHGNASEISSGQNDSIEGGAGEGAP